MMSATYLQIVPAKRVSLYADIVGKRKQIKMLTVKQ